MTMIERSTMPPGKQILRRFADFLEYLLLLVMILECNSMYLYATETVGRVDMYLLFYRFALILGAAILLIRAWLNPKALKAIAPFGIILILLLAYAVAFYCLNVRQQDSWRKRDYAMNFLLLLPLLMMIFKLKQQEGKDLELLRKHADIVCVLAGASLVVYLASTLRADTVPADVICTRWNDRSVTQAQINLLDVCQSVMRNRWQVFGISMLRNRGLFTEPLMFSLQLFMALYTELFLREKNDRLRVFRSLILSATLVTVSATIGLILTALGWGIKGISVSLRGRRRWLVIPILLAAVCACGVLYMEKDKQSYEDTEVSVSSLSMHIEDYENSLKGFAQRPLLGGGYQNTDYIQSFMREYRLKNNPGLSNSAGVILAEGGAMLGLMCMLPFGICLLYLLKRRDYRIACWAIGAIGAYIGVIFLFRQFLMLFLAFGYSLLDIRRAHGGRPSFRLALVDTGSEESTGSTDPETAVGKRRRGVSPTAIICTVVIVSALLIAFGAPVWRMIHVFLRSHQFSVGQAPLRSFCLMIALLVHGVGVRRALHGELPWPRMIALLAWDAVYLLVYPILFSAATTLMQLYGVWGELRECALLLAAWLLPGACLLLVQPSKRLGGKTAIATGLCVALVCGAGFAAQSLTDRFADEEDPLVPALKQLVQGASGKVYVDDLPTLYARQIEGVNLTTTHDSGYDIYRNASVVFKGKPEYRELFEQGFQVAELTEGYLVYSSDAEAIARMTDHGLTFHQYYPFRKEVDLRRAAKRNSLELTDDGAIIVEDPTASIYSGPYDTLFNGQYTLVCDLHAEAVPDEEGSEDRVCMASITYDYGKEDLGQKELAPDALDEDGNVTLELPFKLNKIVDGVEYKLIGEGSYRIEVRSMAVRQSPDYITVTRYNSHRDPIREAYYKLDETPYVKASGYAALERDYNLADRVTAIRYFGANDQPVLMNGDYFEIRYGYNRQGSRYREYYYGIDGQPIRVRGGYASKEMEYDTYGNPCVQRFYDEQGNPTLTKSGYAELRRVYDDRKQVIREEYYDTEGKPKAQSAGHVAIEQEYDDEGNVSVRRFYAANGRPYTRAEGYAEVRWTYDNMKRIVREEFYDLNGEPVMIATQQAANEREYDDAGNVSVYRYYNTDGELTVTKSGYAEMHRVYNEKRQIIREAYYGADGMPMPQTNGHVAFEQAFDNAGNKSMRRYLDADGKPFVLKDGYAEVRWQYDDRKQVTREAFYGPDGEPVMTVGGQAANERDYDDNGNVIEYRYYDAEGDLTELKSGYAIRRCAYNENHKITEDSFFDANDHPAFRGIGYCRIVNEYNDEQQLMLSRYLDADGQPVQAGSAYMHEYLQSLMGRDLILFISIKNEGTNSLTPVLLEDLKQLGVKTGLKGKYRYSYYAVISPEQSIEDLSNSEALSYSGTVRGVPYTIASAGYSVGNASSIIIDGVEYSKNARGMNIVVFDPSGKAVVDSVSFDTNKQDMTVTR